jgi:hypothetical protein
MCLSIIFLFGGDFQADVVSHAGWRAAVIARASAMSGEVSPKTRAQTEKSRNIP